MKLIYEDDEGRRIEIQEPGQEYNIYELGEVIKQLLLAIGYHPNSVDELFGVEQENEKEID